MASCTFLGLQGWCHRSATRGPFAAHAKCCSKTLLELVGISVETLVKKHSRSMFSAPEHLSGSLLQHGLAAHPGSSSPRLLVWRTPRGRPEDARRMPGYGHRSCWSCWAPGGAFFRCFSSGISIASDLMAVFIFWGGGGKRQEQHNQQLLRCWLVYLAC